MPILRGRYARIVDDGVHSAHGVDLLREFSGFTGAAKVADDYAGRLCGQIVEHRHAFVRPRMQNDLMPIRNESARGGAAEPVGATGDEDPRHVRTALG